MSDHVALARPASTVGRRVAVAVSGVWYLFWKLSLIAVCKILFRLKIEGREHEPARGPFIAVGNHASILDPPLIGMVLRHQASYMAKDDLFSVPVLGAWLRSIGSFPVRRGQPDRRAIRKSLETLERGGVLVMFPEGTRSPDGRLQDPEPGAAFIALRTGAIVLPAAVVNSHRALPKGAKWPRLQQVTVRVGPPFRVPRVEGRLDQEVLEEWGQRIIGGIAKLLPPDQQQQ